jgi:hypothetical protein
MRTKEKFCPQKPVLLEALGAPPYIEPTCAPKKIISSVFYWRRKLLDRTTSGPARRHQEHVSKRKDW